MLSVVTFWFKVLYLVPYGDFFHLTARLVNCKLTRCFLRVMIQSRT